MNKTTTTTITPKSGIESVEVITKPRVKTGEHATQIFVFWQDKEGDKGIAKFNTKPELDEWIGRTDVSVLNVIRGRERKIQRRIVFA